MRSSPLRPVAHRLDALVAALCAAVGFAATWQTGRIGFYPFDQSIVFDGAWRVASGQVPWRDFVLPNGLTPILMQAAVFKVFGVSWSSYVLHSATMNTVSAAVVYAFLRRASVPWYVSGGLAVLAAATVYPPAGTPYLETHAIVFCVIGLTAAYRAASADGGFWSWFGVATCFAMAALAKQIPTVFLLPLPFVMAAAISPSRLRALVMCDAGFTAIAALLVVVALMAGVDLAAFWEHTITIPVAIGSGRVINLLASVVTAAEETFAALPFTTWVLVVAILLAPVRASTQPPHVKPNLVLWGLAVWLTAATWIFSALTLNAGEQALGLIPLATGLAIASVWSTPGGKSRLEIVVAGLVAIAAVADAVSFHRSQNLPRRVHDMFVEEAQPGTWTTVAATPAVLADTGFVVWQVPPHYTSASRDFAALVQHVRQLPDNVVLVGDETILYGLAGKPSVTPFLWFHPGLVWERSAEGWAEMNRRLTDNLDRYHVTKVIVPDNISWWWWSVNSFGAVGTRVGDLNSCDRVGSYRVCDLAAGDRLQRLSQ